MQAKKYKYPLQGYKQNLLGPLKTRLKRAKLPLKSEILGSKRVKLGVKNYESTTKLERQNGAKCRFYS
jgi:hypothetical protein